MQNQERNQTIWHNCQIATMAEGHYNLIEKGVIVTEEGKIRWIGSEADFSHADYVHYHKCDLEGRLVTPGFIDCHTHLVFGGNRSEEFEARLEGVSYTEIAKRGGGIQSTVNATRQASEEELFHTAKRRIEHLIADGVTTVEIKSGYGLDLESELKMLSVIAQLKKEMPISIHTTFLAAHALPKEFGDDSDRYIDYIIEEVLPKVVEHCDIDALDAFCEHIAFSPAQVERLFIAAKEYQIPIKLHAEQLSSLHGSTLAAKYGALSADHMEYADDSDAKAMAEAGTVAVLLPGAFYMLRETQYPPIEAFKREGVKIALSTDLNPGTSPLLSLRLALNMGCTLFKLTPEEALAGVTYNAAFALGVEKSEGSLEVGKLANFVAWEVTHPAELSYWLGGTLNNRVIYQGIEISNPMNK